MTAVQDCVSIFESEVKSLDAFMETSKLNPVFMATKKMYIFDRRLGHLQPKQVLDLIHSKWRLRKALLQDETEY